MCAPAVWFVAHAGELCFTTEASSGKIKCLRHTTQLNIAPGTARGEVLGEWRAASARLLTPEETTAVKKIYALKYGLMKSLFDLAGLFIKSEPSTSPWRWTRNEHKLSLITLNQKHPGAKITFPPECKFCYLAKRQFLPPGVRAIIAARPEDSFCLPAGVKRLP